MGYQIIDGALANGAQFRSGPIGMRRTPGDKLLFYSSDPALPHLTIHQRADTGEIDVHLTKRRRGRQDEYTPVLRITPDGLLRAMSEVAQPALKLMLGAIRNLEIDFLKRRRIEVVAGLYPQGATLEEWCTWQDPRTLEVDERRITRRVWVLKDPTELLDAPDGVYDLREVHGDRSRSIGVAIKGRDAVGEPRSVWLKWKRWFEAVQELEVLYLRAITRHASVLGEMWPASANENLS